VRKNINAIPTQSFNTPRGTVLVSTPEATAVDLVGYYNHVGGLDQVATVLSELADTLDPDKLVVAAQTAPIPWAQRLGYLLELVEAGKLTQALKAYVRTNARQATLLLPSTVHHSSQRDEGWKLDINTDVEAEQ
jgi:predicted transcriptional regulator of viral defense system